MSWPLTGKPLAEFNRLLSDWKQYGTFPFIGPDDIKRLFDVLVAAGLSPRLDDVGNRPQYWLLQLVSQVAGSGGGSDTDILNFTGPSSGGSFPLIDIEGLDTLQEIILPSVVRSAIYIDSLAATTSISLSKLVSSTSIVMTNCGNLSTVDLSSWVPVTNMQTVFYGNAFSQDTVDHILSRFVANVAYLLGVIDLTGGTNSPPSSVAPGSDYAVLVARGVTVNVNP